MAIVALNFTGKTSISGGIRLALIGYIPELGKLPGATLAVSSEPEMSVCQTFGGADWM